MDTLNAITGGYKKQFIEDIIEGMTPFNVGIMTKKMVG